MQKKWSREIDLIIYILQCTNHFLIWEELAFYKQLFCILSVQKKIQILLQNSQHFPTLCPLWIFKKEKYASSQRWKTYLRTRCPCHSQLLSLNKKMVGSYCLVITCPLSGSVIQSYVNLFSSTCTCILPHI